LRNTIGINFNYYVEVNKQLYPLESPSSLVPVNKELNLVRLKLKPSTSPPLIPFGQSFNFYDASKKTFYSSANYNASKASSQTAFQHQAVFAEGQRINRQSSEPEVPPPPQQRQQRQQQAPQRAQTAAAPHAPPQRQPQSVPRVTKPEVSFVANFDDFSPHEETDSPLQRQHKSTPSSSTAAPSYEPYRDEPYSDNHNNNSSYDSRPPAYPPQKPDKPHKQKSASMFDRQFNEHNNKEQSGTTSGELHALCLHCMLWSRLKCDK
jgi:hypothetical protein